MTTNREIIAEHLMKWQHVTQQPHRFGGIEFRFKGKEIGHLHGDTLLDIPSPSSLRDPLIASGRAQPHHVYPNSNWVSIYLTSPDDLDNAIEVLRIKYDDLERKE